MKNADKQGNYFEFYPLGYENEDLTSKELDDYDLNWLYLRFTIFIDGKLYQVDDACLTTFGIFEFIYALKKDISKSAFELESHFIEHDFKISIEKAFDECYLTLTYFINENNEDKKLVFQKKMSEGELSNFLHELENDFKGFPIRHSLYSSALGKETLPSIVNRSLNISVLPFILTSLVGLGFSTLFWPAWIIGVGVGFFICITVFLYFFFSTKKEFNKRKYVQKIDFRTRSDTFMEIEEELERGFPTFKMTMGPHKNFRYQIEGDVIVVKFSLKHHYLVSIDFSNDSCDVVIDRKGMNFQKDYLYIHYKYVEDMYREIASDIAENIDEK